MIKHFQGLLDPFSNASIKTVICICIGSVGLFLLVIPLIPLQPFIEL